MTKLAFVDIETTGLDPVKHEPWEVAIILEEGGEELDRFHEFLPVRSLEDADSTALRIGGFWERHPGWDIGGAHQRLMQLSASIARFTADAHLVGNVVSFDALRLEHLLRTHNVAPAWHYHLIDCEALAAGAVGKAPPWNSKHLSAELEVELPDESHTAMGDAEWSRRLYYAALKAGMRP